MSEAERYRPHDHKIGTRFLVGILLVAGVSIAVSVSLLIAAQPSQAHGALILIFTSGLGASALLWAYINSPALRRWFFLPIEIVALGILLGVWISAQIWYTGMSLSSPYLGLLVRWKNYLGVFVLGLGLLLLLPRLRLRKELTIFTSLWLIFVVLAAISMVRQGILNPPLLAMYAGWIICAGLVFPHLLNTRRRWLFVIGVIVVLSLLPLAYYIGIGSLSGRIFNINPQRLRLIFGFNAPHKYAHSLLVVCLGMFVLRKNSTDRMKRSLMTLGIAIGMGLILLAGSRNTWLFVFIFGLTLLILNRRFRSLRPLVLTAILCVFALSIMVIIFLDFDFSQASGILAYRQDKFLEVGRTFLGDATLGDWLLGTSFQGEHKPEEEVTRDRHLAVIGDRLTRKHIENMYFQILLSHGLIGLATFILPLGYLSLRAYRQLRTTSGFSRFEVMIALASIIGLSAQSLFIDTIPSFGNSLAIFMPILWVPVLTDSFTRGERAAKNHS
jgi:hypothetical protein